MTMPTSSASDLDIANKDIFELLGLSEMPDDKKQEMLSTMLKTINNRILARILDNFSKEERAQLDMAFDRNDKATIGQMLLNKGLPDIEQLTAEEALLLKIELVNNFAKQQ